MEEQVFEEDVDDDVLDEIMDDVVADVIAEAETEALNYKARKLFLSPEDMSPENVSPQQQVAQGCSPLVFVEREVEGEVATPTNIEVVERSHGEQESHMAVGSFSSGIPSTPGRGFRLVETSRGSEEHQDIQPMEESGEEGRPNSEEGAQPEDYPAARTSIKAAARSKMKAPRKGKSTLRPTTVGDPSRASDVKEHSGIDREVQSAPREEVEHVAPDASMSGVVHVEAPCLDLNVSSPVEEVAAAVLEVGQGRSQRSSPTVVVADEPALEAPTNEAEVVVRTEVICLDSDDDMPERCVQLDVRVKVKDPAPRRVRGTSPIT